MAALDRRGFLGVAALAAGTAALPAVPRSARLEKLKKSLGFGMVHGDAPLRDKFQLLVELGFEGVELDSPSTIPTDQVLEAKEASGLAVSGVVDSVHWRATLGDPDVEVRAQGRAALETALRDCKLFGGTSVLLVPAVVDQRISYDQAYTRSQEEIRRVLPLAAELGVPIAIENVWNNFLLSPLEAARYVDEFESPFVCWHMDVGNVVNYGWPEQWIRILGKRIRNLHVKEFSRGKRDEEGLWKGFAVELGEGDCNWPAVTEALDEIGYAGWATAEVGGGERARLSDVSQRMDRILAG